MSAITFRSIASEERAAAAEVLFVALYEVALRHGVRPTLQDLDDARDYVSHLFAFDPLSGVLGELDGHPVAVGWLHSRGSVATIGPLAVVPALQGQGLGHHLLGHLAEAAGRRVSQIRLVQDAFDDASMGLFLRGGFRIVSSVLELELPAGAAGATPELDDGTTLRARAPGDGRFIVERDLRVFGGQRGQDVNLLSEHGTGVVAERAGRITGYAFGLHGRGGVQLGPGAADDPAVLRAMLGELARDLGGRQRPVRVMVPAGDRRVVDGLVESGFRVSRVCTYMIRGGGMAPPQSYVLMSRELC